jgi:hypothetical protein
MFASIEKVKELIAGKAPVIVAGDEALLRSLPKGNWIGGTIPYFMTPEGGQVSHTHAFVTEVPEFARSVRIVATYDEQTISRIGYGQSREWLHDPHPARVFRIASPVRAGGTVPSRTCFSRWWRDGSLAPPG